MAKVLIVEDEQILRDMYQRKFTNAGFDVQVATNGEEGLEKMKSFMPDIVLMDLMMPKLSGFDALVKAKADSAIKHIPVVILTNLSTSDDQNKVMKGGALKFIIKSDIMPNDLITEVKTILKIP